MPVDKLIDDAVHIYDVGCLFHVIRNRGELTWFFNFVFEWYELHWSASAAWFGNAVV